MALSSLQTQPIVTVQFPGIYYTKMAEILPVAFDHSNVAAIQGTLFSY